MAKVVGAMVPAPIAPVKIKGRCARLEHTLNKDQRRWITGERCEVLGKLFSKYLVGSGELFTFAAENKNRWLYGR